MIGGLWTMKDYTEIVGELLYFVELWTRVVIVWKPYRKGELLSFLDTLNLKLIAESFEPNDFRKKCSFKREPKKIFISILPSTRGIFESKRKRKIFNGPPSPVSLNFYLLFRLAKYCLESCQQI